MFWRTLTITITTIVTTEIIATVKAAITVIGAVEFRFRFPSNLINAVQPFQTNQNKKPVLNQHRLFIFKRKST